MDTAWLPALFWGNSAAQSIIALALAIALGLALGSIRIHGIGLGVGGVLFSALLLGHLGIAPQSHEVIEFVREFGLILFVFTIGLQVGPGFVESFRRSGVGLNIMAIAIVVLGVLITLACTILFNLPSDVAVGLFSGAVTNTPSLAAAGQMFAEIWKPEQAEKAISSAGIGYAVAYPFGIVGIIVTMLLLRLVFRIDIPAEVQSLEKERERRGVKLRSASLLVCNPSLEGMTVAELQNILPYRYTLSRIEDQGKVRSIQEKDVLHTGMHLHVVCKDMDWEMLRSFIGRESDEDLRNKGTLECRTIFITNRIPHNNSIKSLGLISRYGVSITRIIRSGKELAASPGARLHYGDQVVAVGESSDLDNATALLGNAPRKLEHPQVMPLFVGILLGVLCGSLPVTLPGLPAPVKLGLAGGPLLVAIVLSRMATFGGMNWYMSNSANLMLREVGIAMFLACVGFSAGDKFFLELIDGNGFYWMGIAAFITVIPLIIVSFIGRFFFRLNYISLCGLLAGSMTDPPALAFATQSMQSDMPSSVYATVYPLTMVLRILAGQILALILCL